MLRKIGEPIGKYAVEHGVKAASTHFSRKLVKKISKSLVHSIKVAYSACAQRQRADSSDEMSAELPPKKQETRSPSSAWNPS